VTAYDEQDVTICKQPYTLASAYTKIFVTCENKNEEAKMGATCFLFIEWHFV